MSGKSCPASARGLPSRRAVSADQKYLEFHLEEKTLREVKALARKAGCTPFEMCVSLLQEKLSERE